MNQDIEARLTALGLGVAELGETACDGCKAQRWLADADCWLRCDEFARVLAEEEANAKEETNG